MSQPHEHDASEAGGELNIVPFLDIIMNVLMFVLATIPAVFTVTLEVNPPNSAGGATRAKEKVSLNLSILIVGEGVSLKAAGGGIGPGCEPGAGITVPKVGGDYDWAGLKACAKKIKDSSADFKDETEVKILADPGTAYQVIIKAMDALRDTPDGEPLFGDVNFALPR